MLFESTTSNLVTPMWIHNTHTPLLAAACFHFHRLIDDSDAVNHYTAYTYKKQLHNTSQRSQNWPIQGGNWDALQLKCRLTSRQSFFALITMPIMHRSRPMKFEHNFTGMESPKFDLDYRPQSPLCLPRFETKQHIWILFELRESQ